MRINAKLLMSCFNKIMAIRVDTLRPSALKQDDFATVGITPSYSEIFVPEFTQQLLDAQKVYLNNKLKPTNAFLNQ